MERLKQLVNDHADEFFTHSKKSELLISKAEQVLDVKLPKSYKDFVIEWGMMSFKGFEFYGLIHGDFDKQRMPSVVRFNMDLRTEESFPHHLIAFFDNDGVEYMCLDTSNFFSESECSIALWDNVNKKVADSFDISFAEYLLDEIEQVLE